MRLATVRPFGWHSPYNPAAARLPAVPDTPAPVAASTTSQTAPDWRAQAAKWDQLASEIRARSEKYQKTGTIAAAGSAGAHEFP